MRPDRISLFPLNVVLFPGELLPCTFSSRAIAGWCASAWTKSRHLGCCWRCRTGSCTLAARRKFSKLRGGTMTGAWTFSPSGGGRTASSIFTTNDPLLQGAVDYLEDEDSCLEPGNQEQLVQLYEVCYTLLFSGMPGTLRSLRRNHYLLQLRAGFRSICCGSSKFWNCVPKRNVRTGWSGIFASGPCIYTR